MGTKNRIRWLLILRLVILFFLFVATVSVQQNKGIDKYYLNFIYTFISISSVFTVLSLFWLKKIRSSVTFGYNQLFWDIAFVTAIIYMTGGSHSIFSFLYILSIINASIILLKRGSFIITTSSSILYTLLLLLESFNVITYTISLDPSILVQRSLSLNEMLFKVSFNVGAFFTVAALSSYLAEQLRKTGEELKESQIDYEELEAINKNIVQSIGSGLITINNENKITFLNQAAEDITGISLARAYSMDIATIFTEVSFDANALGTGKNRFEFKYKKEDGKVFYLGLSLSHLRNAKGNDLGRIIIFQDLTNIKEMEEQLRVADRLVAIGKMAAVIAHEIRNPMASISASIQMLRQEEDMDESNKKLMDIILRESDRLNQLITDFLLFAKPSKLKKESTMISLIVSETLELLRHSPVYKNSRAKTITQIDDNITIHADPQQLRQIFYNLFINALEAMPDGGELKLTAQISTFEKTGGKEYVEIIVKDDGEGILSDIIDQIYDPFFTTKEHGTGLGLAIVYRIIENHDGQLFLNYDVEKGTEFHILLPV